ncbi:hypothetical protein BCR44DRAFT_1437985 [Catenaria anguillulae PL171]|uniref:Uncharacterized protein n=1 Tax=Catenaria anguillulae PL171 TaxID=765915 RepID=A0A1Y2HIC8_9FUNG|nr:hypothetical protein BCR44DRAFT_1437985 [Catenaria anguillulae PL171]
MEDFILKTVFAPPSHRPSAPPKIVLRANDFPYNLRPELEHWVLWADRKLGEHQIKAVVNEWLLKVEAEGKVDAVHYPEDEDKLLALTAGEPVAQESPAPVIELPEWVYWVNPPERQTIPGVWHAHILVNRE